MIVVVSAALIAGSVWGVYGSLPDRVEGFIVALAGGALLVSATIELIQPSIEAASVWVAMGAVLLGAVSFSVLDYAVEEHWGPIAVGDCWRPSRLTGFRRTWPWEWR